MSQKDINLQVTETKKKALNTMIEVPVLDAAHDLTEEKVLTLDKVYATGRRKEAVAKAWLKIDKSEKFSIEKMIEKVNRVFKNEALSRNVISPLVALNVVQDFIFNFDFNFSLLGGGKVGQSDALKLAFSKCLVLLFPEMRSILRKSGFLTSDSRRKEREHPGFRTSRKPQQYSRR